MSDVEQTPEQEVKPKIKYALATTNEALMREIKRRPNSCILLEEASVAVQITPRDNWFFHLPAVRTDRADSDCKHFVAGHHRQFLPYLQLLDTTIFRESKNIEDLNVYMYLRGKGGDETRLHDLWSVGVGGHVEGEVNSQNSLYDVLKDNVKDEVNEEVGYEITDDEIIDAFTHGFALIVDSKAPTEAVHLGLAIAVEVDPTKIKNDAEEGIITKGQFIRLGDLLEGALSGKYVMERWSKIVLCLFAKTMAKRFEPNAAEFLK